MPSNIWTPAALSSNHIKLKGTGWRFVEAQHIISTMKLVDTLDEQERLESILDQTKPQIPTECDSLHYLLSTPFRYAPYPTGSRFRRAGITPGVFYGSEHEDTALAELTFYRLLFYAESPGTPWPNNSAELTAFMFSYSVDRAIDLSVDPFAKDRSLQDPFDYHSCQALSDAAREADTHLIRYLSVRDPQHRHNLAILTCLAFAKNKPADHRHTWRLHLNSEGAHAICEHPRKKLAFKHNCFADDPRIARRYHM